MPTPLPALPGFSLGEASPAPLRRGKPRGSLEFAWPGRGRASSRLGRASGAPGDWREIPQGKPAGRGPRRGPRPEVARGQGREGWPEALGPRGRRRAPRGEEGGGARGAASAEIPGVESGVFRPILTSHSVVSLGLGAQAQFAKLGVFALAFLETMLPDLRVLHVAAPHRAKIPAEAGVTR